MKTKWQFFDLEKNDYSSIVDCIREPEYCKFMERKAIRIEMMNPDEYIKACADNRSQTQPIWKEIAMVDKKYVERYAEDMMNGDKFPVPYIDRYHGDMQEGRHRAMAIRKLYLENRIADPKFPVVIIYKPQINEADLETFERKQYGDMGYEMRKAFRKANQ